MVVMDSTTLLLLFFPSANPPLDETHKPVTRCKERIEYLLQSLTKAGIKVMVPTPVLSELLVQAGPDKAKLVAEMNGAYAFRIEPFDTRAAIEVAHLTDADLQSGKPLNQDQTKAKVKYDRQIVAIAKVNGVATIYSDDRGVAKRAEANGMTCIRTADLPLPPEDPQQKLELESPTVQSPDS